MIKIPFEDGVKVSNAKVTIDGNDYNVTPAQYSGTTPLSAYNLNQMQDNIETAYEPEIMYANLNTSTSVTDSSINIDNWGQNNKSGNNLTIENGKIKIGTGINKVLIIFTVNVYAYADGTITSYLKRNNSSVKRWVRDSILKFDTKTITSTAVIDVVEGDTITAMVNYSNATGCTLETPSSIIVQKIA